MFYPQPKPEKSKKKKRHYIKPGDKTLEWEAAKRILKPAFAEVGIGYCEIGRYLYQFPEYAERMERHRHNFFLTWAHGDKRNNLVGQELITLVALSCVDCHNFIEAMPHEEMRKIVEGAIAARRVQPATYYYDKGIYQQ